MKALGVETRVSSDRRLYRVVERGVSPEEHPQAPGSGRAPDWESIRLFLEIVRRGSFRSASESLGISINVLRRKIDELERELGLKLLTRHVDGVRVTSEAEKILATAEKMEEAAFGLLRARDQAAPLLTGEVRIAITEGLGTFWLTPRLIEFQRAYPHLKINLSCTMRLVDVLRSEADVSIQLSMPTSPDLKVTKLGCLHIMPFAGLPYIDTYGLPKDEDEFSKHKVVLQSSDQTATPELYSKWFSHVPQEGFVTMLNNVSSANYWAVAKGAGIGWLPTYAPAIGARIVPVDVGYRHSFDILLAFHPDANKIPRLRRVIDWLVEAFAPSRFPWFRDEFIHPDRLQSMYTGGPLINMFEGFTSFPPEQ
jgi:DNA-binding transcriptional LysR family regulator